MKYKVGDIVKLSTGEKGTITKSWGRYSATIEADDYNEYNFDEKEIIGLWEERNSVNSSVKKYDFPDVGEMAEPTDNTTEKIEELNADYEDQLTKRYSIESIVNKLNEVIRKLNKEG